MDHISLEIYFKIFDAMNLLELLHLYNDPPNKTYRIILDSYYNFKDLKYINDNKSLLSLIYKSDLLDEESITDDVIFKILIKKKYNIIKNKNDIVIRKDNIVIEYITITNSITEIWYKNYPYHRIDGPAVIYWKDGKKTSEIWYKNNRIHRIDGPAMIYWEDGKKTEIWYKDGERYRIDGPALSEWINGQITNEKWYKDDICYKNNGRILLCNILLIIMKKLNLITINYY